MRAWALMAAIWMTGSSAAGQAGSSQPAATAPTPADRLAVEGLNHAARSLGHLRDEAVVGRAGRIRALLEYAAALQPGDPQAHRQLVDLYEGLNQLKLAAQAAERYSRLRPNDHALALRWMRLAQADLSRADERIALLQQAADRKDFLPETKAAAWAGLCAVRLRQGEREQASAACQHALALDALQPAALEVAAQFGKQPAPADSFALTLSLFRSNPRSLSLAWKLAQMLQAAGAYETALSFYAHAYELARQVPPGREAFETLLVDYLNAMLDAAQAEKAVAFFEPLSGEYGYSLGLRALMVEALRSLQKDQQADATIAGMSRTYEIMSAKDKQERAAELAWFDLEFRSRPQAALEWAKTAAMSAGGDAFVQRVLGAAELAAGEAEAGVKRLAGLVEKDVFAAAILADYYYRRKSAQAAGEVLLKAPDKVRTGPAWRRLSAIAAAHKVELPPLACAQEMVGAAKQLPQHYLELGRSPERFIVVRLMGPAEKLAVGEPVAVTVELENISAEPIALGSDGLLSPVALLSLTVTGPSKAAFEYLTPVELPAPRYLAAGQKLSQSARLDVGPAEQFLAVHPLEELALTVSAMLDPLQRGKKMSSSAPTVKIEPISIRRSPLFAVEGGRTATQYALAYIVRDLRQVDLRARLRAARQTASLLAFVRQVELGNIRTALPEGLDKPVLLSMMRAFLQDAAAPVRAEMLGALQHVELDERMIGLLAPAVQDESPLVRMRLIELLGAKRTAGHQTLVKHFRTDPSQAVRAMAEAVSAAE